MEEATLTAIDFRACSSIISTLKFLAVSGEGRQLLTSNLVYSRTILSGTPKFVLR